MASLADLADVYAPVGQEAGFTLADIELDTQFSKDNAKIASDRLLRNFSKFDLPTLLSSQAARGAFHSTATENKRTMLETGLTDQLSDVQFNLAREQAKLAANALLAQTGIRLGG